MIGPPGLPKYGRRVFSFAAQKRNRSRQHQNAWKWVTGLYLAGVLAHFSHHMVGLPDGSNPSSEPYGHMRAREEKGLRPGGFGLLLVRQMVDELLYNEARNEVLFVKYTD